MTEYTSTTRVDCAAAPGGQCEFTHAQVEMMRKMELVEKLGEHKGGVINAFYKPGEGWLITYKLR
jgi:hypothetical protein